MVDHGFDPDDRDAVKFVDDEELAYVMLRYRQTHDFAHVLCGLPPTVLGELALKWFELVQTGMPMCALSALAGPLKLPPAERRLLRSTYAPWALRAGATCRRPLLAVRYEDEFATPLVDLRRRLGNQAAAGCRLQPSRQRSAAHVDAAPLALPTVAPTATPEMRNSHDGCSSSVYSVLRESARPRRDERNTFRIATLIRPAGARLVVTAAARRARRL